jgi:folylpolyglutamate synthase
LNFSYAIHLAYFSIDFVNNAHDGTAITELTLQKRFAEKWRELAGAKTTIKVFPTIDEALEYIEGLPASVNDEKVQVFITGSIHLVGTALSTLENVDAL